MGEKAGPQGRCMKPWWVEQGSSVSLSNVGAIHTLRVLCSSVPPPPTPRPRYSQPPAFLLLQTGDRAGL